MRRRRSENDMSVGASESKRIYASDSLRRAIWKRLERGRDAQLEFFKINVRIWFRKMKAGRDLSVFEHQHRLEQAGDARGGFQMPEIGFDRTDRERRIGGTMAAKRFGKGVRFN